MESEYIGRCLADGIGSGSTVPLSYFKYTMCVRWSASYDNGTWGLIPIKSGIDLFHRSATTIHVRLKANILCEGSLRKRNEYRTIRRVFG